MKHTDSYTKKESYVPFVLNRICIQNNICRIPKVELSPSKRAKLRRKTPIKEMLLQNF